MATRQYIGARYVPKFYTNSVDGSATWESNVVYEPLTYVTLTNGHMYISKKQVPATVGTPASNANYWLDVGSYNGFIDDLQNQIDDMQDGDVEGSLQYQINLVTNKRMILIGDSYAERTNSDGVKLATLVGKLCGVDVTNSSKFYDLSVNGIGFTNDNSQGTFLNQLQNANIADHDTITDIMVLGGANDYLSNETNLSNAISDFFTYAKAQYPNATIYVGCISRAITSRTVMTHHSDVTLQSYKNATLTRGGKYLANTEYIMHYSFLYESDKVHPTTTGVNYLARGIAQAYNTGAAHVDYEVNPALTGGNNTWSFNSIVGPAIYQFVEDGISGMKCGDSYFRLDATGEALTAGYTITDFVTLSVYTMLGFTTPTRGITLPCEVRIYNAGVYVGRVDGFITVNDHGGLDLGFRTEGISPVTNVNQLHVVVGGSVVCPTREC